MSKHMGRRTPSTMVVSYRPRGHVGTGLEVTGGNPRADLGCGLSSPHRRRGMQRPRSGRLGPGGARRPFPQDGQAGVARVRVPGRLQVLHPGPAKTRPAAAAPRRRQGWPGWPLGTSQPRGRARGAGSLAGPLPALAQSPDVHRLGEAWCRALPLGMSLPGPRPAPSSPRAVLLAWGGPRVHGGAAASPTGASCAAAGQQGAPTPGRPTSCRPVPEAQVPAGANAREEGYKPPGRRRAQGPGAESAARCQPGACAAGMPRRLPLRALTASSWRGADGLGASGASPSSMIF